MSIGAATDIRNTLTDPLRTCERLGLVTQNSQRQGDRGLFVLCPLHGEKTPSCSVTRGPDGTIRFKCWGCQETGDVLHLVAAVHGLDVRANFTEVLAIGAEIAGMHQLAEALRTGANLPARPQRERPRPAPPPPEKPYPPADEIAALWAACGLVQNDREACRVLVGRKIDPVELDAKRLAAVIPHGTPLPRWASYRGNASEPRSWLDLGYRLLLRVADNQGHFRSLRAWRLTDGDTPKRLPVSGFRARGLVLANRGAVGVLMKKLQPKRVLFVEGEPDFLVHATRTDEPVFGLISGGWTKAHADKIPASSTVVIRTHRDQAGEKYAAEIVASLDGRCLVRQLRAEAA